MTAANGGPAFPVHGGHYEGDDPRNHVLGGGMSLRDYFAAKALNTCLGYEKADIAIWEPVDFARHAYQVADAMLAERAKEPRP